MDNVSEIVALLRKQADLELAILNGHRGAVATEQELEATRRRLFAHPQALNAVLQTARALRRTPDAVSVRDVADFGESS
jgi:proline dehydrogenase